MTPGVWIPAPIISSRPLEMMMGAVFEQAFGKFAESFEERANEIYGAPDQKTNLA